MNHYFGKGGSVQAGQIPELTDLEIASKPTTELIVNDPEIISRFNTK